MNLSKGPNAGQRAFADHLGTPMRANAGAGTGKTTAIILRVQALIESSIPPRSIMMMTFSRKAAEEMRGRVRRKVGVAAEDITVGTFHSIAAQELRRLEKPGERSHILDQNDAEDFWVQAYEEVFCPAPDGFKANIKDFRTARGQKAETKTKIDPEKQWTSLLKDLAGELHPLRSEQVNQNKLTGDFAQHALPQLRESKAITKKVEELIDLAAWINQGLANYERLKREQRSLDYDDALSRWADMLKNNAEYRDRVQSRWQHVLVDEYQDTNYLQEEIIKNLNVENLTVVGDVAQCIPGDEMVLTPSGERPIASLNVGDEVIAGIGRGATEAKRIREIRSRDFVGDIIEITTERGFTLRATSEHICFARASNRIFASFDTNKAAQRVFADYDLDPSFPHHEPAGNLTRPGVKIIVTLAGARKRLHSLEVNSLNPEFKPLVQKLGFKTEKMKGGWRFRAYSTTLRELLPIADQLKQAIPNATIVRRAKLHKGHKLQYMPAGSLRTGMETLVHYNGEIIADMVKTVRKIPHTGKVYDLEIEEAHNFIVNGVAVHNCVYAFRSAVPRLMLEFHHRYKDVKEISLVENHRSKDEIIAVANHVLEAHDDMIRANNPENPMERLRLKGTRGAGGHVRLVESHDPNDEMQFLFRQIKALLEKGVSKNDIIVLARTSYYIAPLEALLRTESIPVQIWGGHSLMDSQTMKDLIAIMKIALRPSQPQNFKRVAKYVIGGERKHDEMFLRWKMGLPPMAGTEEFLNVVQGLVSLRESERQSPAMSCVKIIARTAVEYLKRLYSPEGPEKLPFRKKKEFEAIEMTLKEVIEKIAAEKEMEGNGEKPQLEDLITQLSLDPIVDSDDGESITLSTVHQAKGLEWPYVFIAGCHEGKLSFFRSGEETTQEEAEEECRLLYVAITRAKDQLVMTFAGQLIRFLKDCGVKREGDGTGAKEGWKQWARGRKYQPEQKPASQPTNAPATPAASHADDCVYLEDYH